MAETGRPAVTSRAELERICLVMFADRGFDVTSVDEIAAAAGIGRRTFFRYFPSKNDVVWGDFDGQLQQFTAWFDRCPPQVPVSTAIRDAVLDFNTFDDAATASLRIRMAVILDSPALQAYSTLRYAAWRAVIANFAARRLGGIEQDLRPRTLGHVALAASIAAYEQWLADGDSDLLPLLRESLETVCPTSGENA
ncbi:mycofactocin system transcriptional regulator [Nakamurella sp. YIM 132087]|uniref:Mycofactocin system transcriptional regulator n=1 Tax=Nakamurella alba TaxID=2665158 RepID=A0A7K1FMY8_9ACTN|nr:mycofactocin system transcriptional regulator [Nakamurella alba]MTD15488.1 mycofactocin system transcriptional regulator [Nakamurella alba]